MGGGENHGMTSASQHVTERIADLRESRDDIVAEIRSLQAQIPLIDAKIEENELLLRQLTVGDTEDDESHEDESQPVAAENNGHNGHVLNGHANNGHSLGTTAAIYGFLRKCEGAVRPVTVVDAIVDRIETESANPRRMIFNTLFNLVKSGKVEKTPRGRVRLPR